MFLLYQHIQRYILDNIVADQSRLMMAYTVTKSVSSRLDLLDRVKDTVRVFIGSGSSLYERLFPHFLADYPKKHVSYISHM